MKKILIETNSNIGDAVMNIPIINFLSKEYPEARFDLICDARSSDIFGDFECVENIFIKNKKDRWAFVKLLFRLLGTRYDLAIGLRSDAVPLLINAKKKLYKHDKDGIVCGKASEILCNFSILRKYFPALSESDVDTKIALKKEKVVYARELIGYEDGQKLLVIAPGANAYGKVWPKENFVELIENIKYKFDKVLLVGSKAERDVCEKISRQTGAMNLAGETTLRQSAALFTLCSFFIGNDSGLGHIAASQGMSCFTVFAHIDISYADPVRYTPYKQEAIFRKSNDEPMIAVGDVLRKLEPLLK